MTRRLILEMIRGFLGAVLCACLMVGCASKPTITKSDPKIILIKTPKIRYYDLGFIKRHDSGVVLQMYASGRAVLEMEITPSSICMNRLCLSKSRFNTDFLSPYYPDDLLEQVLTGSDIFQGRGAQWTHESVMQTIHQSHQYAIVYTRTNMSIRFHDSLNRITLTIKDTV
jgi:hypothetical protein